jgi:hypothetical protein
MKESEFNDQAKIKLHEFEIIADLKPSADWNMNLMKKIDSSHRNSGSGSSAVSYGALVFIIVVVNMGIILSSIVREPKQSQLRDRELELVVNEFLINPVSINN